MIRKHQGIYQSGGNKGKLKKGYKYSGKRLKNGIPKIVKAKNKLRKQKGGITLLKQGKKSLNIKRELFPYDKLALIGGMYSEQKSQEQQLREQLKRPKQQQFQQKRQYRYYDIIAVTLILICVLFVYYILIYYGVHNDYLIQKYEEKYKCFNRWW